MELDLPLTDEVIEERYNIFGGEARFCFRLNKRLPDRVDDNDGRVVDCLAQSHVDELIGEIKAYDTAEKLHHLLALNEHTYTSHRLLHFVPSKRCLKSAIELASPFVVEKLSERMLALMRNDRERMKDTFSDVPQAGALLGHIFNQDTHEAFRHARTVEARLLTRVGKLRPPVNMANVRFTIDASYLVDVFDITDLSPSALMHGPYHKPKTKKCESIDSFYMEKIPSRDGQANRRVTKARVVEWNATHRLLLFPITVSNTHDVNASEIIKILDKLELLEAVAEDLSRVALAFVVPRRLVGTYKGQNVVTVEPPGGDDSVGLIKNIGPQRVAMLMSYGIRTVDDLGARIDAYRRGDFVPNQLDTANWLQAMKSWITHGQRQRDEQYGPVVAQIPQYVCTWEW
ncbi:hypothetical protein Poli38472_001945 [Pythium oligandrum]|uniref:Uncharacterized protein n=1 Tax=Pythium oligandrum TaxID=41045 RepID=A0A8K1CUI9_PYTOL|nr:hypothetical protein Poli38472_001945 [Pythium oligandrum]|eukprot:TMW69789.1 hypothetical protein Poli38472_001945 [Pythium oligandrum]